MTRAPILRLLRRALLGIFALAVLGCLFLLGWHGWRDSRLGRIRPADAEHFGELPPLRLPRNPLHVLPVPREVQERPGSFTCPRPLGVTAASQAWVEGALSIALKDVFPCCARGRALAVHDDPTQPPEGYLLEISLKGIRLGASSRQGVFYGLMTLRQLLRQHGATLPCLRIADAPSFPVRGFLLDVSRDKIPTLDSLERVVDRLAELKYNQLQLYVEGFSFAYPSFEPLWKGRETPLTGAEIQQLDRYCRQRFVELVPNQNSLGHMSAWLETPAYADLAECPEGLRLMPLLPKSRTTLNPLDPRSLELVRRMSADLLPSFSSPTFNMNLDEPFELGRCRSRERAEREGTGALYAEYVREMHALARQHGKRMQMWADVASQEPRLLDDLPEDITLLEWGYDADHPFRTNAERIRRSGHPFLLCPGTSSWMSFSGRVENMMANVENAARSGQVTGAAGLLMTDWGDMGHWQYWPASWAGLAYGAALAWNADSQDRVPLADYLDEAFFQDGQRKAAGLFLELGRYQRFEETNAPHWTTTFLACQMGLSDRVLQHAALTMAGRATARLISGGDETLARDFRSRFERLGPYRGEALEAWLSGLESAMAGSRMRSADAALVRGEFANTVRFIRLGG